MKLKNKKLFSYGAFLTIIFIVLISFLLTLFTTISAFGNSNIGNVSSSIIEKYAPNENLKGWINISLTNEPFDSSLTSSYTPSGPANSITIKELLEKNTNLVRGKDYNCTTSDCGMVYTSQDEGSATPSFNLNSGASKLIGFKISGADSAEITDLTIDLTSTATESCSSQLKIDVGDDKTIEWYASSKSEDSLCEKSYGCYSSPQGTTKLILDEEYCEDINISSAAGLIVGTNISGSGNANFTFSVDEETCSLQTSSGGIISCVLNITIFEPTTLTVCLKQNSGSNYHLYYERTAPVCGSGETDFSIFAQPIKYGSIENIVINSSFEGESLGSIADHYLAEKYDFKCSADCYIPIRIYSNQTQQITINSANLSYKTGILNLQTRSLYSLSQTTSKMNMPFTQLTLDNAGLKVPNASGFYNLSLKLNNVLITKNQIEVLNVPIIEDVYPLEVPAAAEIRFYAKVSGTNITSYKWSFGDNTTIQETLVNYTTHKYNTLGTYTLWLSVKNIYGESNRSFTVKVVSPKNYLNSTLIKYSNQVNNLKTNISTFPPLVKSYIERTLNLSGIETRIATLKAEFNAAGNDTLKQIDIMNNLLAINLPEFIGITERISGKFVLDSSKIDVNKLKTFTRENISATDEQIKNALFEWFLNSLDTTLDVRVYSPVYKNFNGSSFSYISVRAIPKRSDVSSTYVIIDKPRESVELSSSITSTPFDNALTFMLDLSTEKTFEFIVPERVSLESVPLYFSPPLSNLSIITKIGVCNFNGICEKDLGENYKNCRTDCKPWGLAILWILLSLFFVFCLYIAAQEWYKRRYESYLFKDKNDLFNLINFIDNAEKQGLKKEEMFQKLKEKGWAGEQIIYAYKKYKGQRTGMWEIPIFKFVEKNRVKKELETRKKIGMRADIPPAPIKPFVRPVQSLQQVTLGFAKPAQQPQQYPKPQPQQPQQQQSQQQPTQQPQSSQQKNQNIKK